MLSSNTSAVSGDTVYIEDVFSTYLYTGNGSTQTITNNIDLSTKGGLVFVKRRDTGGFGSPFINMDGTHLYTTGSDVSYNLYSFSPNNNGFYLGSSNTQVNGSGGTYASWTFRKQPKFFDTFTYTGSASGGSTVNTTINHSLGSTPGCIIIKCTTKTTTNWIVWHRSMSASYTAFLNTTDAAGGKSCWINNVTSTTFQVNTQAVQPERGYLDENGQTYVAYIFAHDAGGFGLTGTDNVISCGSYTGNGATPGPTINLGWEPQFLLVKNASAASDWYMYDNMRGLPVGSSANTLSANTTAAELTTGASFYNLQPTGFQVQGGASTAANASGNVYIYIAIRRGPMKVPTDGTTVFSPYSYAGNSGTSTVDFSFSPDTFIGGVINRTSFLINQFWDRLRGKSLYLQTSDSGGTQAEVTDTGTVTAINQFGVTLGPDNKWNGPYNYIMYALKRAPGFYDEVCYTGTGSATTFSHNLGVAPSLMIVKSRSAAATDWAVYYGVNTDYLTLNSVDATNASVGLWNNTSPTSSVFTVGNNAKVNTGGATYIAYLFANCPGISKVGSYTGTGTTLQINCGFTSGARFVMIKRTDSTGDWYVWDTARGIVSGNDPYNRWNVAAAQVTTTDYIDPYSAGFEISSTATAAINVNSSTYIYLAIA